jgi:hypothetical protein
MGVVLCWDTLDADQTALRDKCKQIAADIHCS